MAVGSMVDEIGSFMSRLGDCQRAIQRADIWIYRRTGGVCRGERLTKRDSMMDIAADFRFLKLESCRIYRSMSRQYT